MAVGGSTQRVGVTLVVGTRVGDGSRVGVLDGVSVGLTAIDGVGDGVSLGAGVGVAGLRTQPIDDAISKRSSIKPLPMR